MKLNNITRSDMINDILKASKRVNQQVNQIRKWKENKQEEAGRSDPISLDILNMSQLTKQLNRYWRDQNNPLSADGKPKMKGMLYEDKFGDIKIKTDRKELEKLDEDSLDNLYDRIIGNKMKDEEWGYIGLANYKTATRMGIKRAENKSYGSWVKNRSEKAQAEYEAEKELHEQQPNLYPKAPTLIKPAKVTKSQMDTFWRLYNQHRNNLKDKDLKEQFYTVFDKYVQGNEFGDDLFNLDPITLEQVLTKAEMFELLPTDTLGEIKKWYSNL